MSPTDCTSAFKVGDKVSVGGQSRHKGKAGIVAKICRARVGVTISGVDRISYFAPRTLQLVQEPLPNKEKDCLVSKAWKFHDFQVYLAGCELLKDVARGRSKVDAENLVEGILAAWCQTKGEIVKSLP